MARQLRYWAAFIGSGLFLAASASPAGASVTLGQLAPGSPPTASCSAPPQDLAQPIVSSGNTYVVPGTGTITSWSHNAGAGAGQMLTMKVFRKIADPSTYQVVGHDGPRDLTEGALNTFPASIAVTPGDTLGLNIQNAAVHSNACLFFPPGGGESNPTRDGDLADGASGTFFPGDPGRLNITAVFVPTNTFTLDAATHNKK
jgi:hypothetical protein